MLTKPDLDDAKIVVCLQTHYGLHVARVEFLPLGADASSAVYRVITDDETPYFLKLRRGVLDQHSISIPKFLYDQGITQIIAPLATTTAQLTATLKNFTVILYPFVDGRNGYEATLSDRQWVDFGAALKAVHTARLPSALTDGLPRETYSPQWHEAVKAYQSRIAEAAFSDATSAALAEIMQAKQDEIRHIVRQAEQLAAVLQAQSPELVVCHTDIHAGNLLIEEGGAVYIVDWDTLTLALKERDLMFIGSGMGGVLDDPQGSAHFYRGYGQTEINPVALAYCRYERIEQDIAAFCEEILSGNGSDEDRAQGLRYFTAQFLPGNVIDVANETAKSLPPDER